MSSHRPAKGQGLHPCLSFLDKRTDRTCTRIFSSLQQRTAWNTRESRLIIHSFTRGARCYTDRVSVFFYYFMLSLFVTASQSLSHSLTNLFACGGSVSVQVQCADGLRDDDGSPIRGCLSCVSLVSDQPMRTLPYRDMPPDQTNYRTGHTHTPFDPLSNHPSYPVLALDLSRAIAALPST